MFNTIEISHYSSVMRHQSSVWSSETKERMRATSVYFGRYRRGGGDGRGEELLKEWIGVGLRDRVRGRAGRGGGGDIVRHAQANQRGARMECRMMDVRRELRLEWQKRAAQREGAIHRSRGERNRDLHQKEREKEIETKREERRQRIVRVRKR